MTLMNYDSHERAETFDYLKNALNETRASLGAEAIYREEEAYSACHNEKSVCLAAKINVYAVKRVIRVDGITERFLTP